MNQRDDHTSRTANDAGRAQAGRDARACDVDTIRCPVCGGAGIEKKQKWFCKRCGQLLQTCCD